MQNKNRKEARLEVVFREVEKLVICNRPNVSSLPWQLAKQILMRTSHSVCLSHQKNQKTGIVVVMAALRVCLTFMRKKSASGEKNARELNPVKL